MTFRSLLLVLLILTYNYQINAQQTVKGKIYETGTDSVIAGVNIFNLNTKRSARSDIEGNYTVTASEGDNLIFSRTGYKRDTVIVSYSMLLIEHNVSLQKQVITLAPVKVISSYKADSI